MFHLLRDTLQRAEVDLVLTLRHPSRNMPMLPSIIHPPHDHTQRERERERETERERAIHKNASCVSPT